MASELAAGQVLLLDRALISSLLSSDDCIDAVRGAFVEWALGKSLGSHLMHVDCESGEFHVKAGGLTRPSPAFACKINGGFFDNRAKRGWPNILGLIVLCDAQTGAPLGVMDSGLATRFRTAASTTIAAQLLAPDGDLELLLCGAGVQAENHLHFLLHAMSFARITVWSRSLPREFSARMSAELNVEIEPTTDLRPAARRSQVIVTATPARQWFLGEADVSPGTFIAAVGSDSPEKQELDPRLVARSSLVCDLTDQCATVGELHHAIAANLMDSLSIKGEIGDILAGKRVGRVDQEEIIVFDSTGTALQDVAIAALAYTKARTLPDVPTFTFFD